VLPVDKAEGPTSHDVVSQARRAFGIKRIGHTGTLDPFASGLLVLCVGGATRLAEYVTGLDKTYLATARLGQRTDTLDRDGAVLSDEPGWSELGEERIREALAPLRGLILQEPPQFSAKKVEGVAAHRRARRGERVALEPVEVTVHELDMVGLDLPFVQLRLRCSSGTYVRALARDLGEALGVGAHLTALRRTDVGDFSVAGALPSGELGRPDRVAAAAMPPLAALRHLRTIEVDEESATRLAVGQGVSAPEVGDTRLVAVARGPELVAIGEVTEGRLLPRKVFRS
jgi:tRNA pseudouridine55 synthase